MSPATGPRRAGGDDPAAAPVFCALDLRPARESHLADLPLCVAAGALATAGHTVRQLRVPLDRAAAEGAAAPRLAAWLADLAAPAVVLVERLWPAPLLERLRGAGACVWWLRQDVRSDPGPAADVAFGLDVDHLGAAADAVAATLAGDAATAAVPGLGRRGPDGWRFTPGPTEAAVRAALRRRWAPRFAWESLPGDPPPTAAAPVVLGNESGCAWRPDARRSPRFADLALDPACVSVEGCTFCLDGGTFAPEPVADTVAFVLRQLDILDAAQPNARRLVLADDQPLPLLGPLLAALAAGQRPPRCLLLKARVPDVLHGEAALRAAGRAAAAIGWTLELHCVGFEAFSDELLALFQKGFPAAAAERAALLLHDLGGAPGLAAGRSRAHGFLLWTPWTTPAELLATARAVRRTRFDALRDDWLETRLRLDRRQPLHARAAADGLLEHGHAGAAVDRAADQGYAPAARWFFADPRTALVDRLLRRPAGGAAGDAAGDAAPSADRLERAVLATSDLTDAAVQAALADPSREAALARRLTLAWRRGAWEPWHAAVAAAAGVPSSATAVDPSVETLRAGQRRAAIVEAVPAALAAELAALLADGGLRVAAAPEAGAGDGRDLLLARAPEDLAALVAAHARLRRREDATAALRTIGGLLGYPECCTAAFAALPDRSDDLANAMATLRRTSGPPDPRLNPFALRQLVPFHPCRYDCPAAAAFADRTAAALAARLGEETGAALARAAAVPLLLTGVRARHALLGARWEGAVLRYERVAGPPLEPAAALAAADGLRPTPDGLRLVRGGGGDGGPLPAERALLLAWGRPPGPGFVVDRAPTAAAPAPTAPAAPAAPASGNAQPGDCVVAIAAASGQRLLRREQRGDADVLVFDAAGTPVRLELSAAEPGRRAFAVVGAVALGYRIGEEDAPALPLDRAPAAARALVAAAVAALRAR